MNTKLRLEYDGSGFSGWARQPGLRSVQEELECVLELILGERLPTTVAGRTDRGVHAWGQVAGYAHEALDPTRLNKLLPDDISILASEPVEPGWDARRSALSRTYCYRVMARRERSAFERAHALWLPGALDRASLDACADALVGAHDFTAFTPTETHHTHFTRCVLTAEWRGRGELLEFWIEADGFLRQMIRTLVGTMLQVARGRRDFQSFVGLFGGAGRASAGPTAPPHGLHLARVSYLSPGREAEQPKPSLSSEAYVERAADERRRD